MRKEQKHLLEYLTFRGIEGGLRLLPGVLLRPFAHFLAFLGFRVFRYRRAVALDNLAHAFPEKSPREHRRIAYRSYHHFALLILEFMKLSFWSEAQLKRRVRIDWSEEALALLTRRREKGMILVSGHFGNWEMGIAMLATQFFPGASIIQKRQKNRRVDRHIIDLRARWGVEMIYSSGAVSKALVAVQHNRMLALLCDQDAGRRGAFVPFFGRSASTPVGAALLHLRSRAELVFGYCIRVGSFHYRGGLIPISHPGPFEINSQTVREVTARFTAQLEKQVRQHPEQYLWLHRRWKTTPPREGKEAG